MRSILSKPVVFAQKPNRNTSSAGNQHDHQSDQKAPDLRTMIFLALAREPRFTMWPLATTSGPTTDRHSLPFGLFMSWLSRLLFILMDSHGEATPKFGVFDEGHVAFDGVGDGEICQCCWRLRFSSTKGHLTQVRMLHVSPHWRHARC